MNLGSLFTSSITYIVSLQTLHRRYRLTVNPIELIQKGGVAMWPLILLSVLSVSTIIERLWFWGQILLKSSQTASRILETAARDWDTAIRVAQDNRRLPIAKYLLAPLRLPHPDPEVFHLALESAADDQLALMRRGDKILEAVIALSPLIGFVGNGVRFNPIP